MINIKILENKIRELEEKITILNKEKELMDTLYEKAKELVIKHNKASVVFLQKKLLIDSWRASRLINELRKKGIVS